jgi:hypothetical protein
MHWALVPGQGSEHTVHGSAADLEVHLVHRNERYANISQAATEADGLLVIGVLFDEARENETPSSELNKLLGALPFVGSFGTGGSSTIASKIDPVAVLPHRGGGYYTYRGSLTTPGCFESVTWIVMKARGAVSSAVMTQFRAAMSGPGDRLAPNFREVQPINMRVIRETATDGTGAPLAAGATAGLDGTGTGSASGNISDSAKAAAAAGGAAGAEAAASAAARAAHLGESGWRAATIILICVAAVLVVAIVALVLALRRPDGPPVGVSYSVAPPARYYDDDLMATPATVAPVRNNLASAARHAKRRQQQDNKTAAGGTTNNGVSPSGTYGKPALPRPFPDPPTLDDDEGARLLGGGGISGIGGVGGVGGVGSGDDTDADRPGSAFGAESKRSGGGKRHRRKKSGGGRSSRKGESARSGRKGRSSPSLPSAVLGEGELSS